MRDNVMDVSYLASKTYAVTLAAAGLTEQVFDFFGDRADIGTRGNVNNLVDPDVAGSGLGGFTVEVSTDGTTYGDPIKIPAGVSIPLDGFVIRKLRVSYVSVDTVAEITVW